MIPSRTPCRRIVTAICVTLDLLKWQYPQIKTTLCRDVTFVTTQELEDMYPGKTPKERENAFPAGAPHRGPAANRGQAALGQAA